MGRAIAGNQLRGMLISVAAAAFGFGFAQGAERSDVEIGRIEEIGHREESAGVPRKFL
jgi:hypothetical protein